MPTPVQPPALPGSLILPTRDQLRTWWLRDYSLRNPSARVDKGSEPYLKASVYADAAVPVYANSLLIARNTSRQTMVGSALDVEAQALGTQRFGAVGASGAFTISASSGGTTIFAGDVITVGAYSYQCTQTGIYADQSSVPVQGISTGPATNQNPGTIGTWQIPRQGCAASATVTTQVDGTGLDGGHDVETDDELRSRLNYLAANPPASGNDAQIQQLAGQCPGLSIQQAFTYPAIQGPGSTSVAFTLRATTAGGVRIPNATQIALMAAWLQGPGQLPADLSITVATIVPNLVNVVLRPTWAPSAQGWYDVTPWPAWTSVGSEPQIATPSTGTASPTYFRIINAATAPSVGQNIAVFDLPNLTFRQKRVLSYTTDGSGGYDITVDTSNGVSDTSYTPAAGQFVCPWSASLQTLVLPIISYFASLGPGEMVSSFLDPGSRQRRQPASPAAWPSPLAARILAGPTNTPLAVVGAVPTPQPPSLATLSSLLDVSVQEPMLPYPAPVGSPGVSVYLNQLGTLVAYP